MKLLSQPHSFILLSVLRARLSESEGPPGGSTVGPPGGSTESRQTEAEATDKPKKTLSEIVLRTLKGLGSDYFEEFKLFLTDSGVVGEFEVIKKSQLEDKTRTQVTKVMKETYGVFTIDVMKKVLKAIQHHQALSDLRKYQHDPEATITDGRKHLQSKLRPGFQYLAKSLSKKGPKMLLSEVYTELLITQADTGQVNEQHEVRQMERFSRTSAQDRTIQCQDIFKDTTETGEPIRVVLTKGVAGVGKTVLTQKFSLDWAEDRANQDIRLLFPLTFRQLNVLQKKTFPLMDLLNRFFKLSRELFSLQYIKMLFILDGLDECSFPLDFSQTRVITDPTESASVEELLVNLIRGELLPFSLVWITTRPAAASQIPAECVSMVTEVRGFNNLQKEQYFIKRFKDQATDIIKHIKSIRSLFIMCYIPVFCWILSDVLQKIPMTSELPKTLTQMYIHFLVVQAKFKNIKYHGREGSDRHWTEETKKMIWSLVKLAFEQLLKGKLIFYETDVMECGLKAAEIAHSGVFTEVFIEESGPYEDTVYCFIHLTVQEFLAALHVHQTFFSSGVNLLSPPQSSGSEKDLLSPPQSSGSEKDLLSPPQSSGSEKDSSDSSESPKLTPEKFYRSAVDLALQSPNGHLDLFLRFLLGLSLPTNQKLLQGLLTQTGNDSTNQETVKYIKRKLDGEGLSAERRLNLLHCLNELNDHSLLEKIHTHLRRGDVSRLFLPSQWSALSFILLSSDSDLEEFDLSKYGATEQVLLNLLPVVKDSTKANLRSCFLTENICAPLASVLVSSSSLTLLDLSNNDLRDSGVELLCDGLKSAPCRLETLRLSGCLVSERGGALLALALSSAPSALTELDLSYNDPGASAELLTALKDDPQRPLQTLRLDPAGRQWMVPGLKKYSCEFSLDPNTAQKNLRLSEDQRTVTFVTGDQEEQLCPDHEDRFTEQPQVLSSTGLRGRCYWEVRWSGVCVDVALSSRGISRRGDESRFGYNDESWSLKILAGCISVLHNGRELELLRHTGLDLCPPSGTVFVFLDTEAGALTFYKVLSDGRLLHIHTFTSSFSEPLFPGFALWDDDCSVSLVDLRTVPPAGSL